MKKVEVLKFLDKVEVDYVKATGSSTEVIIIPCPFCGNDKEKFYVNIQTGLFQCKVCGEKGNFFKLQKTYGVVENIASTNELIGNKYKPLDSRAADEYHEALKVNSNALQYIKTRGFSDEIIAKFKLGYKTDNEGEWITIPHFQDGKLWNFKSRRFNGDKTFRRINGQPTILFNIDNLDYSKNSIILVESETDCIAAVQMGRENVVALTAGADTFKPEWIKIFTHFKKIYVVLNSDEAGQKGARKVAEKIGLKKVKNVILPTNDVNDYLTSPDYTDTDFRNEFSKAVEFKINDVGTASDIVSQLDEWYSGASTALQGIDTGFEQLDKISHGLKEQDLIILSGDSGMGKTTFLNNIVNHQIQLGRAVFGFYLEGQIPYYFTRMIGAELGLKYEELNKDPELFEKIKKEASELPFYFYNGPQGGLTVEYLKEYIPAVVGLYDIKLLIIDNLQKMIRGTDNGYHQRVGDAVSVLKDLAVDLKLPIILISHIRKTDKDQKVITMHDAKSSSTIYQDADLFLILQVIKKAYYLTIEKNRMGEGGINIPLEFNKPIGSFAETAEAVSIEDTNSPPRVKKES